MNDVEDVRGIANIPHFKQPNKFYDSYIKEWHPLVYWTSTPSLYLKNKFCPQGDVLLIYRIYVDMYCITRVIIIILLNIRVKLEIQ